MRILTQLYKPNDYGSGWNGFRECEIGLDNQSDVVYIEYVDDEGETIKFGIDTKDAQKILKFLTEEQ